MLEARDLTLHLGRTPVLQGVRLNARHGEVTIIVGPNGSGKTSTLKALTGELGFSGTVKMHGRDITAMRPAELAGVRAVLPQKTRMAFPFNVREVVQMGLIAGLDAGRSTLPDAALARVGLAGFGPRFYHELSGGEQQRVQLARTLVQVWKPVVDGVSCWLFLDEPVAALDIAHQLQVMETARDFAARGGGVLAVMHDLNLTAMFAHSVALMEAGRVAIQGAPHEVLTDTHLSRAYGCPVRINTPPTDTVMPYLLPQAAGVACGPTGET